jgi:hypothetical protein
MSFKIAIGHKIQTGPYGGGNAFVKSLSQGLVSSGNQVFFDLYESNLDFIIMTDPRASSPNVSFAAKAILQYLKLFPNTIVIHRINECDERKGTHFMNLRLRLANYCADHTVYVGAWLKKLNLINSCNINRSSSVILNGGDQTVFNSSGQSVWSGEGPLKIVTHHWGGNWMKGFDVYSDLDNQLANPLMRELFEFTYIGSLPKGFKFKYANYIEPLSGEILAQQLKSHHVYLTASINEPGGNHQIEGGLCGLPIIYRNSGCLPEYCDGYGLIFEPENIIEAIHDMRYGYHFFLNKMSAFPHTANLTVNNWIALLDKLNLSRSTLISSRHQSYVYHLMNKYLIY